MSILSEFRTALREAIDHYEQEQARLRKSIPATYKRYIAQLRKILADSETVKEKQNAVLLRQEVEDFLQKMDISWFARHVPVLFGDDLYESIQTVLNNPNYRETILLSKRSVEDQIERDENNERQRKILGYLENHQIAGLIQTIEDLEARLNLSEQTATNLREESNRIQTENEQLKSENQRLVAENTRLRYQQPVSSQDNIENQSGDRPGTTYRPPGIFNT